MTSNNIYWKDALASGKPIKDFGSVFMCGDAVCFWHGQEARKAQEALERAANPPDRSNVTDLDEFRR